MRGLIHKQIILNHLNIYGPSISQDIKALFHFSERYVNSLLKDLVDEKLIIAISHKGIHQNIYYLKGHRKPRHILHSVMVSHTKILLEKNGYTITKFFREDYISNDIKTDATIVLTKDNKEYTVYLEVELSHNSLNNKLNKYERLYANNKLRGTLLLITYKNPNNFKEVNIPVIWVKPFL